MPIIKLTNAFVSNHLHCPPEKGRIEYCCDELPGLYVEVRSSRQGQGTYYLRYKDRAGKTCHQKIGRTATMSLPDARKQAKTLKAEISLGADPRGEVKAQKAVITFAEFFDLHYLPYVTARKRSYKRDEELYRLRVRAEIGHKRLNEITRQQVQSFHTSLLGTGLSPATCDHHVKLIRHALNLAVEWQLLDTNRVNGVHLFHRDNRVEHYLDEQQLQTLLNVLRTDENRTVCQIALYLLSTGARLNEALQATWNHVDKQTRVWRIPATNSKSKRMRSVPLNDSALDVLAGLDTEGKFEHLFVNLQTKKPYVTIMKVWARLRAKAGLPHLRIHDLRLC